MAKSWQISSLLLGDANGEVCVWGWGDGLADWQASSIVTPLASHKAVSCWNIKLTIPVRFITSLSK